MKMILRSIQSFVYGLVVSAACALFFYFSIFIFYRHPAASVAALILLTVICSAVFRLNIKSDRMLDVVDVFSKTISFDMKPAQPRIYRLLIFLRPAYPYVIAFGTMLILIMIPLCVLSVILYWFIHPDPPAKAIEGVVFAVSEGISMAYCYARSDRFPSVSAKGMFLTGALLGPVCVLTIIV